MSRLASRFTTAALVLLVFTILLAGSFFLSRHQLNLTPRHHTQLGRGFGENKQVVTGWDQCLCLKQAVNVHCAGI
jgi:hypothetical protein